jgi:hypothetical protein
MHAFEFKSVHFRIISSVRKALGRNGNEYVTMATMGGPQSRSGLCGEENNLLPLPGIKTRLLGHPARSLVSILTVTDHGNGKVQTAQLTYHAMKLVDM